MDCKVNYYRDGSIKEVVTPIGTKSKLFEQLSKLPFVKTLEDALHTYKNIYTKSLGYVENEDYMKVVDLFESRLKKAKEENPEQYWSVDEVSRDVLIEAAKNGRIVDVNGGMGVVTPSGDMKGLFKYNESAKGTSMSVQEARIAKGGIKLDNYDGYLTKLYEKKGFRVVSRVPFNEDYSRDLKGWDKAKHGTPDVVAMIYDPQSKLKIEEKTFDDYDEAMAYRDSYVEEAKALKSGKQNTEFFEGKAKEASSNVPYSPVLNVDQTTPVAKAYALYTAGGNFTGHISKMIAGFQEKQKQVAEAIVKGKFKSFLDIGTSEGGMIKTVASQNKDMVAVGVDPNLEMQKNFNSTPEVDNAEYRLEAFQGSWIEDDGTEIKEFKTNRKFDVVNEDFTFQFVNNNRAKQVAGVKEMMSKDGIFVTSEKFHTSNEAANEVKKYDHQRKYFSPDQLTEDKQTIVSGMADDMVGDVDYFNTLKDNFRFVEEFWNAGNFKGYLASDNNQVLQEFKKNVGDLNSEFTDVDSLTSNNIVQRQVVENNSSIEDTNSVVPVLEKLLETDLADNVYYLSSDDIQEALRRLGATDGKSVKGVKFITSGFIHNKNVYINKDHSNSETAIHEFNHLYTKWLKENNPEVYNVGLKLVAENKDGVLDEIIKSVSETQPDLVKGSEEFNEEVLTEAVGRQGAKILAENSNSPIGEWLQEVWDAIKNILGLSDYSIEDIMKMSVEDYTRASAADLLSGKVLPIVDNITESRAIKPFTESYPLSFVKPTDVIDFKALVKDIQDKGQKVWFWMADQLGRGSYKDSVTGEEHYVDAGLSYAFDPANRERGAIWATGVEGKDIENRSSQADYIFLVSGSPTGAKLFNKTVFGILTKRNPDYQEFKRGLLKVSKLSRLNKVFEENNSWEEMMDATAVISQNQKTGKETRTTARKYILAEFIAQAGKKSPLKQYLESKGAILDLNEIRDGFLAANDFKQGDVIGILKPAGIGEKSTHSTYENEVKGEVVGVPDIVVNSFDLIPEEYKKGNTSEIRNIQMTFTAPYGIGVRGIKEGIKFQKKEPVLEFKSSNGTSFLTYKEALLDSNSGDISIGVTTPEAGYKELFSTSSSTNVNTVNGFVNSYIKSGLLSDERIVENGKSYYKSSGGTEAEQIVNEFIIDEDAKLFIGTGFRLVERDGKITLNEGKGQLTLETKNGIETVNKEVLNSLSNEEIIDKYVESDMLLASKAVNETIISRTFGTPVEEDVKIQLSENELSIRLLGLLEKMGVKVTTISEYIKNSKNRNGVEPNAEGLADIANQIIALKNGEIDLKALTEETSHFIVEAWDEGDISNLLRAIDKTEEYKEFASSYREIYARQGFTGEELENLVRKEILGKVLAKSIASNFSVENKTEEQSNIIDYIKNLFSEFIKKVGSIFKTQDEISLDNFTTQVKDLILNQNIDNYLNLNTLREKKFVMYQTAQSGTSQPLNTILRQSKNLIQILQQQEKDLLKANRGLKTNVNRLREIEQDLDEATITDSIITVVSTAKRQTQYISQAADQANKNNNFLTNEEGIVYHSLKDAMLPSLAEIKDYLLREKNTTKNQVLISEIDSVIIGVSEIVGKIKTQDNVIMDSIINRMMDRHNLPESAREALILATKAAREDTSAFYATFGQLTHARDPLLNMAGAIISDLHIDANTSFLNRTKPFQEKMRELGFTEKDLKQFFDKGGYISDIRDWNAFQKVEEDISAKLLKSITGVAMSEEDIIKYKKDPKSFKGLTEAEKPTLKTPEQSREYRKQYRAEMSPYIETVYNDEYYKKEEDKYKKYGISDLTIKERRNLSADRGTLFSRVKDENGRMRFTNSDKYELNAINILRKKLKSLFDEDGGPKLGIRRTQIPHEKYEKTPEQVRAELSKIQQNTDILEVGGWRIEIDRAIASDSSIVAFDLNKLDAIYQLEADKGSASKLSKDFLDELKDIESGTNGSNGEGREAALEFFRMNAFTNFSEEYWNSLEQTANLVSRLEGVDGGDEIAYILNENLESRKQIIKQYQSQQDPSNILVEEMSTTTKNLVLSLTDSINMDFLEGLRLVGDKTPSEGLSMSENTPNEAYFNATKGMNDSEKLQFILKTTNGANIKLINQFMYAVDELNIKGKSLSKSKQSAYDKFDSGTSDKTVLKYAESKLAPFYVRFAPKGFSEIQNKLENSTESVHSIVSKMNEDPLYHITNNFSYEKAEDNIDRNKNYIADFDGGFFQPKLDKFRNDKFYSTFNPTVENGKVKSVGSNEKLYELYTTMMDYHRSNLSSMGELGTHNLYKAPQISKTSLNKLVDIIKKKDKTGTMKETLRDFLFYRVDDLAYGAEIDGDSTIKKLGTKYIPKYYLRDLENQDDISEDLFYSMTAFGQQATLYESRKNAYSDMMAIQESLLNRAYPDGKSAEASATLKMFNSFNDANIYGVKEVKQMRVKLPIIGEVDLTKNIRFIHKWVITRSLGFNAIIPFTSAVTAITQTTIEKYVGEFVNKHSVGLAWKEFTKLAPDAMKDTFNVNSTAKLNVLLEHLNVYEASRRYGDSIYSKTFRTLPKLGMALNEAGNFPIIPKVVLSILYDYRLAGDSIMHFKQFEAIGKENGDNKAKIESDWKALESKAIYNYMNVDKSLLTYDLARMKTDMGIQPGSALDDNLAFEKYVYEKEKAIISRTKEMVKRVDGQIPEYERSEAQRHVFLSYLTTFRGWLTMAYAYRFKNQHFNLQSGNEEEGSYRSAGGFISDAMTNLSGKGFSTFIKDIKEQWVNASEVERNNIRRVLIEVSLLQAVVAVGWMIAQAADDDKNKDLYALQLTNYMYARLMNESTSAQLSIGSEFYSIVQNPIVGADTVSNIFAISNYYDTTKIEGGRYSGMYKFQKQFMSVVPGYKSLVDMKDPKSAYDSYTYFNKSVDTYNPVLWLLKTLE